jgi:amidase
MNAVNPLVNAVVIDMSQQALQQARQADLAVKNGEELGPLHGVPVTVKVNVDVKGQPNSAGIKASAELIASKDAPVVKNIRDAGAIIIGLTNMPDLGTRYQTDNDLYGLTKNPWDETKTCGGSSGGAGAALAAGIGPIAHGNDIGGSLRMPAYCCGVSSIRPTLGRVPGYNESRASQGIENTIMCELFLTDGPMAREVRDVRLLLDVMAKGDANDPWWMPVPLVGPVSKKPVRVAITTTPAGNKPHPVIAAGIQQAAEYLAAAGYAVEEAEAPFSQQMADNWNSLISTEILQFSDEFIQTYCSEGLKTFFYAATRAAPALDMAGYMNAMKARTTILRQWQLFLEQYPIVITPFSLSLPYRVDEDLEGDEKVAEILTDMQASYAMNFLGLPAAIAPIGLHEGVPYGIQIVGQKFREDMVLDAAETIQAQVGILPEKLWRTL